MQSRHSHGTDVWAPHPARHRACQPGRPVNALHLVKLHELETLREGLVHGRLPVDFEAKLARLADSQLLHRFIERQSRLFLALLQATQDGRFQQATAGERERLLRVLAYVRKDDDAIHDDYPGGYADDHLEVRTAVSDLHRLLTAYKHWRLCHEVPRLWLGST